MTDLLERLAAANPVRMDDLAPSIEDVWRKLDDSAPAQPQSRRPPRTIGILRRRGLKRLAAVGVGAVAAGVAVLVLGTTGGGPSSAFAGWTATPTGPASGETAGALDRCTSQLAGAGGGLSGIPAGGWQPVVTDTRGPFTAMVLQSGSASATCINGPSFTSTAANDTQASTGSQHNPSQHTLSGRAAASSAPPSVSVLGLGGSSSGPISQASQAQLTTSGGRQYTFVQGQVVAGVTRVTLVLSDGSNVQATVGDRSFIAWWPGSATTSSAQVGNASGVRTQQLTFTPLSAPKAARANSSHNAPSSP
jgi:hypothetical protein